MKSKHKLLSAFLTLSMLLSMLLPAAAEPRSTGERGGQVDSKVTWALDDNGVLTISGTGPMTEWYSERLSPWDNDARIRQVIIGDGVTSIGSYAFRGCSNLTSITIPDNVTSVGDSAFHGCTSLTSITIPDSVTSIGYLAFYGCTSLTNIELPDRITSIGYSAFYGCIGLTSVVMPAGISSIEDMLFSGCTSLVNIELPDGVTSIGYNAFYNCTSLTNIAIPNGVTSIEQHAFMGCTNLPSITIPDGVTSIEHGTFGDCNSLTSITIPASVTSIGSQAFLRCTNLMSIDIPDGVTSIGNGAFWDCSSLTSITIPEGVTSIESSTFHGCSNLTDITIPVGVTSIGTSAFRGCGKLKNITLPKGLSSIGESAFYDCSNLNVEIPDSVTEIGDYAFNHCVGLSNITISPNMTTINKTAFQGCTGLTSVTIPNGVTSIREFAFNGCAWLKDITYSGTKAQWSAITIGENNDPLLVATIHCTDGDINPREDDVIDSGECGKYGGNLLWELTSNGTLTISGTGEMADYDYVDVPVEGTDYSTPMPLTPWKDHLSFIKKITVATGTTSIGSWAFAHCKGATEIVIPDGITSIGHSAYLDCDSITNLVLPDSITSIDASAFLNCTKLNTITLPVNLSRISHHSLSECGSLISVTIHQNVSVIEANAFNNSDKLSDIYFSDTMANWKQIDITERGNAPLLAATIHCTDGDITPSGEDGYTYTITSQLGNLDQETGHYVADNDHSWDLTVDAPTESLADVYIDGAKLTQGTDYTVNTAANSTSITIDSGYFHQITSGLHTLAVEMNAGSGNNIDVRRAAQNFVIWPVNPIVLPDGYVGMPYSYQIINSWTNYELWESDEVMRLPDGLTLGQTTGLISGTPTKAGVWYFSVDANSPGAGGGAEDYKITIKDAPEAQSLPEGVRYVPYTFELPASDRYAGYTVSDGRLPQGLELDEKTGVIQGVPVEIGTFEFKASGIIEDSGITQRETTLSIVGAYRLVIQNNTNAAVQQKPNDYPILENVGTPNPQDPNSFYMNEYRDEVLKIDGPYEEFHRLLIDGVERVRDEDYTVREGSTIITIRSQTFRDVGEGTHTIAAEFRKTENGKTTIKQVAQNYTLTIRRPGDNSGSGSSSSSSSSSNSGSTNYRITVPKIPNCTVKVSPISASAGTRVTLTVTPNTGYILSNVDVTGSDGKQVSLTQAGGGKYTFRMPNGKVSISAQVEKEEPEPVPAGETPFVDMLETDWFYSVVVTAYKRGWMVGTSDNTFAPQEKTSRGMIVSVLHRIAGQPVAAESAYFSDVPLNQYYASAAAWAAENGIVSGYGDGRFGPADPLTREQIVMTLYNFASRTGMDTSAQSGLSQFSDLDQLSSSAQTAMSWAHAVGLISGCGDGTLNPTGTASRAEMAAFLVRFSVLLLPN